jgi:hypothetical protein
MKGYEAHGASCGLDYQGPGPQQPMIDDQPLNLPDSHWATR